MTFKSICSAIYLLLSLDLSASSDYATQTRFLMDTYVTINIPERNSNDNETAIENALNRMQLIDSKFNHLKEGSPLYSFNNTGAPVTDPEILHVVKTSLDISHETSGAFDPTMSPLIKLWGFYTKEPQVPDAENIKKVLKRINFQNLILNKDNLQRKKGTSPCIDLGAIAKGYAIKQAVISLSNQGVTSALIDAGGDIYALGKKPSGEFWKVGIKDPHSEGLLGYIEVENMAVVGSGDYERFFIEKGKKYHHIFDPATGYPTKGLSAVTVVHPDPMAADAIATTIFVLGLEKGLQLVETIDKMETIIVTEKHKIHFSSGLEGCLKELR